MSKPKRIRVRHAANALIKTLRHEAGLTSPRYFLKAASIYAAREKMKADARGETK